MIRRIREAVRTIREDAMSGSLDQRMSAVSTAVQAKYGNEPGAYCWTKEVFDDYVVIQKGDKLWQVSYTIDSAGAVTLDGELQQVRATYVKVGESVFEGTILGPLGEDGKPFVIREAVAGEDAPRPSGRKWSVAIIQEGMSKNRNRYGAKPLQEASALYENKPVYVDHEEPSGKRVYGRSGRDKAGFIKGVRPMLLGVRESAGGLLALGATLVVTKATLRQEMLEAWEEGHELFGLSHDVQAESVTAVDDNGPFYDITKIVEVDSVDLVTNPAAGGRLMRLVASNTPATTLEGDGKMLTRMIESIKASGNAAAIKALADLGATPDENGVMAIYEGLLKATTPAPASFPPAPVVTPATRVEAQRQDDGQFRLTEAQWINFHQRGARTALNGILQGVALPDPVKESVRATFEAQIVGAKTEAQVPTEAVMLAHVASQVELFGKLAEAGVVVKSSNPRIEVADSKKVVEGRLDDFFDPSKPAVSFRSIYVDLTGDVNFTGQMTEGVRKRLTESIGTTTFDQIMGDSITRRMLKEYAQQVDLNNWRGVIADVVPLGDFRTQRRMRMGGYGNLPLVGQGAPYMQLTTPSDEEATYAPAKRGGTESVTIEAITNDDVGVIRKIPQRLSRSAAQTLHEFVWDFLATNAAIYDSVALAAVGHSNIVTSALTGSNLSTLRLKLKQQTDMTNGKRLGFVGKTVIVPSELEELAWQYTTADRQLPDSSLPSTAAPAAPNPVRRQGLQVVTVDYWTDTNNYWVVGSPDQGPMMEVGFLGGREEPELFVQDMPNVGSLFSHDAITWKIRHVYGAVILDFRLFAGGIVP